MLLPALFRFLFLFDPEITAIRFKKFEILFVNSALGVFSSYISQDKHTMTSSCFYNRLEAILRFHPFLGFFTIVQIN